MERDFSNLVSLLKKRWYFIPLPGYREFRENELRNYDEFEWIYLPPIDHPLTGEFEWLKKIDNKFSNSLGKIDYAALGLSVFDGEPVQRDFLKPNFPFLLENMSKRGRPLPLDFQRFVGSEDLYTRIRSCTDCHFDLSVLPARVIYPISGLLFTFLVDSQSSPCWSLFIDDASGQTLILESRNRFGYTQHDLKTWAKDLKEEQIDLSTEFVYICAYSFEEFMFRFWIENEIWYNKNLGLALKEPMKSYAEHYSFGVAKKKNKEGTL